MMDGGAPSMKLMRSSGSDGSFSDGAAVMGDLWDDDASLEDVLDVMFQCGAGAIRGSAPSPPPLDSGVNLSPGAEAKSSSIRADAASDVIRWHTQGFVFSNNEGTRFGLVQKHGGPCGVLASVEATLLCVILFGLELLQ